MEEMTIERGIRATEERLQFIEEILKALFCSPNAQLGTSMHIYMGFEWMTWRQRKNDKPSELVKVK
jgi:hypothetical protein